jgi:cytoskeletal protein CcmA (bactofilin family)
VNSFISVAALVLVAGLMFMLPLIPAFVELRRKSDALPLSVVQQNAGEIRHFANSFRSYIRCLEPIMQRCVDSGTTETGTLSDGEKYIVLGRADEPFLRTLEQRASMYPDLIVAGVDLIVPSHATFSKDIYAARQFEGGEKANYRAIRGEQDVHLGAASRVLRWVHAVGEFTAEFGCALYGRVSSDLLIRLHAGCSFLRMNAPRIEIGHAASNADATRIGNVTSDEGSRRFQRFLHDGDFEVLAGQVVNSNLVICGNLRIRSGARVRGSVKSVKDMVIEDGVSVEGSLISARKMRIGAHCAVHGPVIAERELTIAAGTHCGTHEFPTTVSAPEVEVQEGVVVFGTLWARERGQVRAIRHEVAPQ